MVLIVLNVVFKTSIRNESLGGDNPFSFPKKYIKKASTSFLILKSAPLKKPKIVLWHVLYAL
jgi:hypothetical protein